MRHAAIALIFMVSSLLLVSPLNAKDRAYKPFRSYSDVSFESVLRNPAGFKNSNIRFRVLYNEITDVWSPFYSPFDPGNYVSFGVWGEDVGLWKKEEMVQDYPFLFIEREHPAVEKILQAKRFSLFEIEGTVRSSFSDRSWIRVHNLEVVRENVLNRSALRELILGNMHDQNNRPDPAIEHFKEGLEESRLTDAQKIRIHERLAHLFYRKRNANGVYRHLRKIKRITGSKLKPELQQLRTNMKVFHRKSRHQSAADREQPTKQEAPSESYRTNIGKTESSGERQEREASSEGGKDEQTSSSGTSENKADDSGSEEEEDESNKEQSE